MTLGHYGREERTGDPEARDMREFKFGDAFPSKAACHEHEDSLRRSFDALVYAHIQGRPGVIEWAAEPTFEVEPQVGAIVDPVSGPSQWQAFWTATGRVVQPKRKQEE